MAARRGQRAACDGAGCGAGWLREGATAEVRRRRGESGERQRSGDGQPRVPAAKCQREGERLRRGWAMDAAADDW